MKELPKFTKGEDVIACVYSYYGGYPGNVIEVLPEDRYRVKWWHPSEHQPLIGIFSARSLRERGDR